MEMVFVRTCVKTLICCPLVLRSFIVTPVTYREDRLGSGAATDAFMDAHVLPLSPFSHSISVSHRQGNMQTVQQRRMSSSPPVMLQVSTLGLDCYRARKNPQKIDGLATRASGTNTDP